MYFKASNSRSKSEDRVLNATKSDMNEVRIQAKRSRRSRRLQKKNSLDVQFRRRFSMLRDGNVHANSIYNSSELGGFANGANDSAITNGISTGAGRDSRASGMLGARASYGNISSKLIDKRFNKILNNIPTIPVKSDQPIKQQKSQSQSDRLNSSMPQNRSIKEKRKSNIADEHV